MTQNGSDFDFSIVTMIKHLERMLSSYVVPVAFVNGDRFVMKISHHYINSCSAFQGRFTCQL